MATARVMSVIGRKDAGKTTLVVALAQEFARRHLAVATIKHGHHPALADQKGKDTWRHYHEGRASQVLIESPGQRVLFERIEEESDPLTLARRYMPHADLILVEGFKGAPLPKIEVCRTAAGKPLYTPDHPDAAHWVAIVTDNAKLAVPIPVFRFNDTSWLQTLGALILERALPLDP
jgi:molybdopterin-guanine dinucleotide biosynthesis protein MobB